MAKEVEDIEFDELMAEKRHKELKGILTAVKLLLDKPTDNSTAAAIEKHIRALNDLVKVLGEQKQVEISSPSVNVEVNQEKVVNSLSELSRDLLEELRKFNNKPIPISFEVKTDNWNNLRTVNIQYSTSDKLNYKK